MQQQHYGERKENDGGEMRGREKREEGGEGESTLAKLERRDFCRKRHKGRTSEEKILPALMIMKKG